MAPFAHTEHPRARACAAGDAPLARASSPASASSLAGATTRTPFAHALGIQPGLTCVVGSGGKTTLIETLAHELAGSGATVLITTTTHMAVPSEFPLVDHGDTTRVAAALAARSALYVGARVGAHKISQLLPLETLLPLATYVLCEADGSARLPFKVHNATEPVVPAWCPRTVCVLGASGVGQPASEVLHRATLALPYLTAMPSPLATPQLIASILLQELAGTAPWRAGAPALPASTIFISQADAFPQEASALAQALLHQGCRLPLCTGSARNGHATRAN
jgi:probable selenium-dependent hydroxylase accessory protein YqeC